jgi:hypothetical protein
MKNFTENFINEWKMSRDDELNEPQVRGQVLAALYLLSLYK